MDNEQLIRTEIDRLLGVLTARLGPEVEAELRPRYDGSDDWLGKATRRAGQPLREESLLDPSAVVTAILNTWDAVWKARIGRARGVKTYLHEVRETRNRWAHHETLTREDVDRFRDTASRLLTAFELSADGLAPPSPVPGPSNREAPSSPPVNGPAAVTGSLGELAASARSLAERVQSAMQMLSWDTSAGERPAARNQLEAWSARLHEVRSEASTVPPVIVTLLGGTGAGKSTLLNAVLGERVLASSNTKACTSAAIEVAHGDAYEATVEFVDRDSWRAELARYRDELESGRQAGDDEPLKPGGEVDRKLRALYGDAPVDAFSGSLRIEDLVDTPAVADAFEEQRRAVSAPTGDELRKELRRYVTSGGDLWPLVKQVKVRGPFPALSAGGRLVDLPGLNDPNPAREAVTRRYLTESRYVWVTFDMRRALTGDVTDALRDHDLFRRLVMEGREGSLVFIGTRSDGIDPSVDAEDLGLDEDTPDIEIAAARNARCRDTVRTQISELVTQLEIASEKESVALRDAVDRLPIFTVSAHNYLTMLGAMRASHVTFATMEQTCIPELGKHLRSTAGDRYLAEYTLGLETRLLGIRAEMEAAAAAARSGKALGGIEGQGDRLASSASAAATELQLELVRVQGQLRQSLDDVGKAFGRELADATARAARGAQRRIHGDLSPLHWSTLRCACRDRGTFLSSTAGRVHLPEYIARPLLESVAISWAEFFGEKLRRAIGARRTEAVGAVTAYRAALEGSLPAALRSQSEIETAVRQLQESASHAITQGVDEMAREIDARISEARREMIDIVSDLVGQAMQPTFAVAAHESGRGTKQRILDRLAGDGHRVLADIGDQLRAGVNEGVTELSEWTAARFADLADDAADHARSVTQRLALAADAHEQQTQAEWLDALDQLLEDGSGDLVTSSPVW
jgi:hypothetical protein